MSDRIFVRDLAVSCIVGIHPKERVAKQTVLINLALECDLAPAARSDNIADTVDYKVLKDRVVQAVSVSEHFLIEKMAEHVAGICLQDTRVRAATVTVDKPGALTGARSVAVEITRRRSTAG
ncbi:MAG: dihydroneopterin aldolase [Lentisphaerae bacterium]|nr:dihydroneopterin aldolase [Lentisphaerota bacterium]